MKKILILAVMVVIMCCFTVSANADSGWLYDSGTGHWYQRFDTPMTWSNAKTYAESIGGYLATITSAEENSFIWTNLAEGYQTPWLGGTDEVVEGDWQWITGETWSYTNWKVDRPDDYSVGQDYLAFYTDATWDDRGLPLYDQEIPFIVESTVVPEPISSTLFLIGGATLGFRRMRKKRVS